MTKLFRKCNTVRRRVIIYLTELNRLGYQYLPLEKAKQLFSEISDVWDRTTLKAYFGTQAHRSKKQFYQDSQYTSGTISHKTITISQVVKTTSGYLEQMGLVNYELKGNTWFMKIENALLVPTLVKAQVSMQNISLAPIQVEAIIPKGKAEAGKPILEVSSATRELEQTHTLESEREKLYNTAIEPYANKLVEAILSPYLKAKLIEEPDRAKTNLGEYGEE